MDLRGLMKLSLLDYPGQVACTVFTGGCNLRCPFCHNPSLVLPERLRAEPPTVTVEAFFSFLDKRRGVLDGVCITGGEPLMQPDLPAFIREIRARGYLVKLDTNGTFPERLEPLLAEGLVDFVAMDVKNSLARYPQTVGIPGFSTDAVARSIRLLLEERVPYEFRTTVIRELHRQEDLLALAGLIKGARAYALQQFVDSGDLVSGDLVSGDPGSSTPGSNDPGSGNPGSAGMDASGATPVLTGYAPEEMEALAQAVRTLVPATVVRGV